MFDVREMLRQMVGSALPVRVHFCTSLAVKGGADGHVHNSHMSTGTLVCGACVLYTGACRSPTSNCITQTHTHTSTSAP
jgi:hypothetical protein